ncbi:hypothetical protein MHK_007188 [Candidatus Magnetomorum sp. HK-1]|nr:hypothetical protein MHK_007188 [Candidatus Magnetomorum sp. HK-1]
MKRNIYNKLLNWKQTQSKKPLILKGARKQYMLKYSPELAIKISGKPLNKKDHPVIKHYPLYLAGTLVN